MRSLAIWLGIIVIVGVDSHNWNMMPGGYLHNHQYLQNPRYVPNQQYPQAQQAQHPEYEIFKGTLDQLGEINAQWICTNQKTGDMIVIGTDDVNTGNNRYPGQNNVRPQYPQYPQYPQQQVPQYPHQHVPQYPQQQLPQNPQQLPQNPQQQLPQNPQQQLPQNPQQQLPQNPQGQQQQQQQEPPKNPGFPELPWTVLPGNGGATVAPAQTTTADPFKNFDWSSYVTTTPATMTSRQASESEINGEGLIEPRIGMRG